MEPSLRSGKTTISAATATESGAISPSENAITASNTELRCVRPPAASSRKGKKTAAIMRTKAVMASMTIRVIAPDRSIVFEGTADMFRDCFFDNASWATVLDWAESQGLTVERQR